MDLEVISKIENVEKKEEKAAREKNAEIRLTKMNGKAKKYRFWKPRKKTAKSLRREQDRIKVMFASSSDPYDQPLRWWESPPIKYA